ncbi:MAG: choice-of-anchor J domain-containing protein, partial [candidate division WOR-3 bacterium]|nr:choice-of-anchor J domain-containing protein [candidate division WOR-3 bacterium]
TVSSSWVASHCDFVVFVQDNSSKEMYQGARIAIINVPDLQYYGYQPANPVPNSDVDLTVGLRNMGTGEGQGVAATLSTTDPYVTVTTPNVGFPDVPAAASAYSTTPFEIHVADSCPNPHVATMNLQVTATGAPTAVLSFPLNVTTTYGFADNMEHGQGSWTHSGILDGWHQSTYRSSSPTHSWYCGVESNHQYTNENDARLMTPYFTLGTDTVLSFEHYYALEANYDYGLVEMNNGSEFWRALTSYTGSSSGWQHVDVNLGQFRGQTVRLRCRFISDGNTTAEGWYIDDFEAGAVVGVKENPGTVGARMAAVRNPVRAPTQLSYQIPAGAIGEMLVYDVGGRLVRPLGHDLAGSGRVDWNLTDAAGNAVRNGTYFVRLVSTSGGVTGKLVVAR